MNAVEQASPLASNDDDHMSPRPNQKLARALLIYCAVSIAYFSWAWERVSYYGLTDRKWPRSFPYPDQWLWALNNYFDAKYPVEPGFIKVHGEIDRVRFVVFIALATLMLIWLASAVAVSWDVAHATKATQSRRLMLLCLSASPSFAFTFGYPETNVILLVRLLICLFVGVGIWLGALALTSRLWKVQANCGE